MHPDDTIAAISTPAGRGGIGIVRLSGKNAIKIASTVFRSPKKRGLEMAGSHRMLYGHICDPAGDEVIDEVLVSVMRAPHTYTKEDIVEINCHGGPVPLRRVLEMLLREGARLAAPGEFTQRAFLNGRIDLAQAEAVLDAINALTVEGHRTAMSHLSGGLSKKIDALRDALTELTAFVEAHIDFPEEDIGPLSLKEMKERASAIRDKLRELIKSSRYGRLLREGLKTAIIGRPNVGKSSLLNALLEHDRAIVTELPGTTRDVIEEYLNIDGIPVRIMDTAGIRSVGDVAEREGVKRSMRAMEDADLVLLLLDGSELLHDTDRELMDSSARKARIIVINKSDLPPILDLSDVPPPMINISARTGAGMEELKKAISGSVASGSAGCGTDIVTNVRHVSALENALGAVERFCDRADEAVSPEFLSVELYEALGSLGEISGSTTPDDILNRIFDNFCIGK